MSASAARELLETARTTLQGQQRLEAGIDVNTNNDQAPGKYRRLSNIHPWNLSPGIAGHQPRRLEEQIRDASAFHTWIRFTPASYVCSLSVAAGLDAEKLGVIET